MTVPDDTMAQKIGLLISYYITLSFWSAQTLNLAMISRNIAGQTKKTVVVASNFIIWAAGNAIGTLPTSTLHNKMLIRLNRPASFPVMGWTSILHCIRDTLGLLRGSCRSHHLPAILPAPPEQEERRDGG